MIFTCTCVLELLELKGCFLLLQVILKTQILNWVNYIKIEWWKGITSQWCSAEWLGELRKLSICFPQVCEMIHYWSIKAKAKISQSIMRRNGRRDQQCSQGWRENHPRVLSFSENSSFGSRDVHSVKMFKQKVNWSLLSILSLKLVTHASSFVQWARKARYFWKLPRGQPQI